MAGELVANPAANGQIHKFWTFELDFLGCYMVEFDESIFSETTGSDLSNGLSLVDSYTLWKKFLGPQGEPMSTETSENPNISNSDQIWGSNGRIFHQFPVLTHNFHSK